MPARDGAAMSRWSERSAGAAGSGARSRKYATVEAKGQESQGSLHAVAGTSECKTVNLLQVTVQGSTSVGNGCRRGEIEPGVQRTPPGVPLALRRALSGRRIMPYTLSECYGWVRICPTKIAIGKVVTYMRSRHSNRNNRKF